MLIGYKWKVAGAKPIDDQFYPSAKMGVAGTLKDISLRHFSKAQMTLLKTAFNC